MRIRYCLRVTGWAPRSEALGPDDDDLVTTTVDGEDLVISGCGSPAAVRRALDDVLVNLDALARTLDGIEN